MTANAHLSLTIDVDSDPISGSVSNGNGQPRSFMGWIELVGAIEAARCTDGDAGATLGLGGRVPVHGTAKTLGSLPGANHRKL